MPGYPCCCSETPPAKHECDYCASEILDDAVVTIEDGTSIDGCEECESIAGTYLVEMDSDCSWFYEEELGECEVCTTTPNNKTMTLQIFLSIVFRIGPPPRWYLQATIGFAYTVAGEEACVTLPGATYLKALGDWPSPSEDCSGAHELTKNDETNSDLCEFPETIDVTI